MGENFLSLWFVGCSLQPGQHDPWWHIGESAPRRRLRQRADRCQRQHSSDLQRHGLEALRPGGCARSHDCVASTCRRSWLGQLVVELDHWQLGRSCGLWCHRNCALERLLYSPLVLTTLIQHQSNLAFYYNSQISSR